MPEQMRAWKVLMAAYDPNARYYQVSYRIADYPSKAAGADRRKALTDYLASTFTGANYEKFEDPAHISTSSWIVEWKHNATDLYTELLKEAKLDPNQDILDVIYVDPDNSATSRAAYKS